MPISVRRRRHRLPRAVRAAPRQRERWGVTHHPVAQPARDLRGPAPRRVLGLLVDWGYRSDGIPVPLFGAWTTLPAGPATLAAKTGAPGSCRSPSGARPTARFAVTCDRPDRGRRRAIRPSSSARPRPSPTRWPRPSPPRPTSGTASSRSGRRAPRRPPTSSAGRADAGRSSRPGTGTRSRPRRRRSRPGSRRGAGVSLRGPAPARRLLAGLPPARGPALRLADLAGDALVPPHARRARPRRARNLARVCCSLAGRPARQPARARGRDRSDGARAPRALRVPAQRPLLPRGRPDARPDAAGRSRSVSSSRPRSVVAERGRAAASAVIFVGLHFGSVELRGAVPRDARRRTPWRRWRPIDDPGLQAWFERTRGRVRGPARRAARGAPRADWRAPRTGSRSASSAIAT